MSEGEDVVDGAILPGREAGLLLTELPRLSLAPVVVVAVPIEAQPLTTSAPATPIAALRNGARRPPDCSCRASLAWVVHILCPP